MAQKNTSPGSCTYDTLRPLIVTIQLTGFFRSVSRKDQLKSKVSEQHKIVITPLCERFSKPDAFNFLFEQYAQKPWSILFDSSSSKHADGRFDIMVADPIATLVCTGALTQIWRKPTQDSSQSEQDPIDLAKALLEEYLPDQRSSSQSVDNDLPFLAGAAGFFGYDLARRFESIPEQSENPYIMPDMALGIYTWSVIKDNHQQQCFLCRHCDYPAPSVTDLLYILTQSAKQSNFTPFRLTQAWSSNMQKQDYCQGIKSIHKHLKAGDCYQVNLAQRFSASYQGSEWQAYCKLREHNQAPFSAYIRLPQGCILSVSPERFLQVKNNQVQTRPIKGTLPRHVDHHQDQLAKMQLSQSIKDQAENLMIVDLLRNDLSRTCQPNSVKVPELFAVESFAAVHHLVSTVTATLQDEVSPFQLLRAAFPGGSITGAPKISAMTIIEQLEPHRRNIYCGSIGYIGINQDMDSNICIRTLLCEQGIIYCWAGGGIVMESNAISEYQETLDKVARILPILSEQDLDVE